MADEVSFSRRHGLAGTPPGTLLREDAPIGVRLALLNGAVKFVDGYEFRNMVCAVLGRPPKSPNTSYDGWREAEGLVYECEWFKVYDLIERVCNFRSIQGHPHILEREKFVREINQAFLEESVGWQLIDGRVVARGDELFERTVTAAVALLGKDEKPTAAGRLQFAISALSTRPKADTSGAVAHATSAVECVLGEITRQSMTLGKYLKKYPDLFRPTLKEGIQKLYGYASDEGARHGKEGTEPAREDAEFAVAVCAAVCTLLTKKRPK